MEKFFITSRNVEITEEMKAYIEKRLKKMERFSGRINRAEIIVEEQRGRFRCEFLVDVNRNFLKAESISSDFFSAIDELKEKMGRQLKKYEERLKRRKR